MRSCRLEWMQTSRFLSVTLSFDGGIIIEHIQGKEEEDQDNTKSKKVM
ncbi:hypothetical protein AVEN_262212-1, partial [Araneus ventricosus]